MKTALLIAGLVASALDARVFALENLVVVQDGQAIAAPIFGPAWEKVGGSLSAAGTGRFLYANKQFGAGDFRVAARLKLERLDGTAASFVLNDSHVGFDGGAKKFFVEGTLFNGRARSLGAAGDW